MVRQYLESLARVHLRIRDLTADVASAADQVLIEAERRAESDFGTVLGLALIVEDDNGEWQAREDIFADLREWRHELVRRNKWLGPLSKESVSSDDPPEE